MTADARRSAPTVALASAPGGTDDPRLAPALESYLAALRAGRRPDRSEFLARDPEIAGALDECLDALEFIQSAAFGGPSPGGPAGGGMPPAALLGDFRIVREVGRGGMGVVYEAEQVSLGRRVALKVLPLASAMEPRQLRRFQIEAQAAAHLQHRNIVPIFAVGRDGGVNYYAMQFIEGRTLADLIRGARPDADAPPTPGPLAGPGPSIGLDPRTVARLGAQAADALEHAHGLGVLHRDIKPANLMVDPRGDLWVTDFGLAQFQESAGPTLTGDVLGTLRYMSPEQARAGGEAVDRRADIYSLGATLYELATLRPAFDSGGRADLLCRVMLEDPAPPRKVRPEVPRDLETIILKAMTKEPASRYDSARALGDDLRRFLAHEPVAARRPSPWTYLARWGRRHRVAVGSAASALVLASVVASALLWAEQGRTARALDDLTRQRQRERAYVPRIYAASNALAMGAMQAISSLEARLASGREGDGFYRLALSYYEALAQATGDDPDPSMREIGAKARFGIGLARMLLKLPGGEAAFAESVAAYEALRELQPGRPDLVVHLAASLRYQTEAMLAGGGADRADAAFGRLIAMLRDLSAAHPGSAEYRGYLADELTRWAEVQAGRGRRPEAVRAWEEAIAADPARHAALNALAWALAARPDLPPHAPARAVALAEKAVALAPEVAAYRNTLGVARARLDDWDGAARDLERSRSLTAGAAEPSDLYFLSMIQARRGDLDGARRALLQADSARASRADPDPDLPRFRDEALRLLEPAPPPPAPPPGGR